ncbi:reverse transcriptase domain-containing protein [Tanacetum coccineum]|uniref:Reverse transcriptase domain-containing protein n=1 Tax=Tanacetum coccineum TaxID=301880 RepID=A0ABQ5BZ29_9ASTR
MSKRWLSATRNRLEGRIPLRISFQMLSGHIQGIQMAKEDEKQIGQNLEAYVDDLVIKSCTEQEVIRDVEETFRTLRKINMKLNQKKCTFGMKEGVFLGYKVNSDGLMVCPDKVEAFLSLPSPKCLKDVQRLNRKLISLNRFLSKSAERSLPFFKTLKKCTKKSDFQWTTEAEMAFQQMKKLIAELPMMVAPQEKEELIIYLAAVKEVIHGSGAGLVLTNPEGMVFTYALRFRFYVTNNEAKYEALIARLKIVEQMGVENLQANVDS